MRKITYTLILVSSLFLYSCADDNITEPLKLRVNVQDINNVNVSGASVSIYQNSVDYQNKTNELQSLTTDSKGVAEFSNLSKISYYVSAKKDTRTNSKFPDKTSVLVDGTNFFLTQIDN